MRNSLGLEITPQLNKSRPVYSCITLPPSSLLRVFVVQLRFPGLVVLRLLFLWQILYPE